MVDEERSLVCLQRDQISPVKTKGPKNSRTGKRRWPLVHDVAAVVEVADGESSYPGTLGDISPYLVALLLVGLFRLRAV